MSKRLTLAASLVLLSGIVGCGPKPVAGGAAGTLTASGAPLSEVQVTVYKLDAGAWRPLGFAETATDGSFALVTEGAAGPLQLPAGDYRVTLESVGAPITIPSEYRSPETSPLNITATADKSPIRLETPLRLGS